MSEEFIIGTASAKPGERAFGELFVAQRVDSTPISMPVILVRGVKQGPILCLSGGIHGNEYAGIEAATRLARDLDPGALSGTLVSIPIVNQPSFSDTDFVNRYDHLNLNRSFPGSKAGRLTERIAFTFLNEVILKCNALVDLHTAGKSRIAPLVIAQGDYVDLVRDLATASGLDLIWLGGPWNGTGRLAALEAGIPAITIEVGGGMACNEADVLELIRSVKSVMRQLGLLAGQPDRAPRYRVMTGGMTYARHGGFFHSRVAPGDNVRAGEVVAYITNPHGDTVEELNAPKDGIAAMVRVVPTVRPGDEVLILGEFVEVWENQDG